MSDSDSDEQGQFETAKKMRPSKNNQPSSQKSHLTDTVKLNQGKKEAPKKKNNKQQSNNIAEKENQIDPPAAKKKKGPNKKETEEKDQEADDKNEGTEQNEDLAMTTTNAKKPGKQAKKDNKDANKPKYSQADYNILVEYLRETNKPYNGTTLESNLKGRTGFKKGTTELALNQGVEEGKFIKKAYGAAFIFWYNQDLLPAVQKEEIEQLTEATLNKQTELADANQALRAVTAQLAKIMQEKTDEQLKAEISRLEGLLEQQEQQLEFYQSDAFKPEELKTVNALEEKLQKIDAIHKKRRRTCEDAVKELIENLEENKSLAQMFEVIGIDAS